jgi:hypothetical protein
LVREPEPQRVCLEHHPGRGGRPVVHQRLGGGWATAPREAAASSH